MSPSMLFLTAAAGFLLVGFVLAGHRLFSSLRTRAAQLETELNARSLELQQTRDRLQRLNDQQQRMAGIVREIAQITDPVTIMSHLVELIHNRLGYHHVYVYQPDETSLYMTIQAAAGTTARKVMDSGHRLQVGGSSLVGRVALEHQPTRTAASDEAAVDFDNTALPGARSEMALPLLSGDRLLAVLDLQSIHLDAFSDEDLSIMSALANQIATMLDNTQLLQGTEAALTQVEHAQKQYVYEAWHTAAGEPTTGQAYIYADGVGISATNLHGAWSPGIALALTKGRTLVLDGSDGPIQSQSVALPITLRGHTIGALQLYRKQGKVWQPEEINALKDVTERLAIALENARLIKESQRRVTHERVIREVTAHMRETLDVDTVLMTAVQEMRDILNLEEVEVQLSVDTTIGADTENVEYTDPPGNGLGS